MPRNPLNPRLPPKDPVTGRRKHLRFKGKKRPSSGARIKQLWQDPEYRAKMAARDAAHRERMRLNPQLYKRSNIPDGMTRAMVKPMWERAYALADRFIQIMKDTDQLPSDEEVTVLSLGDVIVSAEGVTVSTVSVPTTDAGKAEAALREAFVLAIGPSDQKIKIQAINTVLNFTKSKPESKSKLTLDKAEDFLDAVANDLTAK